MRIRLYILVCLLYQHVAVHAQMKIGDNSTSINGASLLELETTNKGLVFPRVSLTNVASSSPLPAGLLTGTIVYNTNATVTNGNGTGFYFWNGSNWIFLCTLSNLSATSPLVYNSATGVFAINQSNTAANGYLSSTDWNTFNNKVGSITLNMPSSIFSTPINFSVTSGAASGTLSLNTQTANTVFAGPASGIAAAPTFRSLVAADIPSLAGSYIQNQTTQQASSNFNISGNGTIGTNLAVNGIMSLGKSAAATGSAVFYNSTNANTVTVNSGITTTGYTLTLPTAAPSANGQALVSTTGGTLSWANVVSSAWQLSGNSGTTAGTNFIGTTDAIDFVTKTNNTERMRILGAASGSSQAGWIGMGIAVPRSSLDVTGNFTNKNVITIQNTSSTGYSSVDMLDNSGTLKGTFGYGNSGTGTFFGSRDYFSTYGSDFVLNANSGNYNLFMEGATGNIGLNTSSPAATLDVSGNFKLGSSGTVLTNIIKGSVSITSFSIGVAGTTTTKTVTVTGANTGASVIVSPQSVLANGVAIAFAYVSAANTVKIGFINSGAVSISSGTITYDITIIQ